VQNDPVVRSCNTETGWGATPAVAPRPSAHSAEEQEARLSPVTECTEGACIPTAAGAGAGRGLAVGPIAPDGTSGEYC